MKSIYHFRYWQNFCTGQTSLMKCVFHRGRSFHRQTFTRSIPSVTTEKYRCTLLEEKTTSVDSSTEGTGQEGEGREELIGETSDPPLFSSDSESALDVSLHNPSNKDAYGVEEP